MFEKKVLKLLDKHNIHFEQKTTPMFIDDRDSFNDFVTRKIFLLQANYYKRMRRRLDILMEGKKPVGGKWSFDEQNRKKLPKIMIFHRFLKLSQGMTLKRYHYLSRKNSVITQGKLTSFFHTRMLKLKIGLMTFLKGVSMILGLTRMRSPKMSIFSYIQC